ncbi:cupredoxin family protein [Marinobacter salinisoli]|uniref:Cupredoxin family protein n=1 Tax=Marinobacter salinisoli TaxID=2769486 RepID=A0ABX7MTW9_9GAMM|nr:cupredoxin family protein [Marinobacter salinisoli]QSP95739.1 cupredoxin family protein [Marinobacter salinisoli]
MLRSAIAAVLLSVAPAVGLAAPGHDDSNQSHHGDHGNHGNHGNHGDHSGHGGHGGHGGGHHGMGPVGRPGSADAVDRVIEVSAGDDMAFDPGALNIRGGQTVKFVVTNTGQIPHEFVIGTASEHEEHREQMRQMMANGGGHHDHQGPNMVMLEPGETKTLIWRFADAPVDGQLQLACNIPGHYEAGMHSPVHIK